MFPRMRIARVRLKDRVLWGEIDSKAELFTPMNGNMFSATSSPASAPCDLVDCRILPPVVPSKIAAVGRNYAEHAAELSLDVAARPRIFFKPPSAVIGQGDAIVYPARSTEVHHEAELAVIIGKSCRHATTDQALDYVLGYTCANDITARDIQRAEGLPAYAKSFDTFCPLGPWIETKLDPSVRIACIVNDELRQDASTGDMIHSVPELIAYISDAMTLVPGDVVLTGTPAGVGPVMPGDIVMVTIEGIGSLSNPVSLPCEF